MPYYCKYCGTQRPSVTSLASGTCPRHPSGSHKGRHALYEGSAKERYICKFCGTERPAISSLVAGTCVRHPAGSHKGRHEPAL